MDKFYRENGYKVFKANINKEVKEIRKEFFNIFSTVSRLKKYSKKKFQTDKDIINFYKKDKKNWILAYDLLRNSHSIYTLLANKNFIKKIKKISGIKKPVLTSKMTVRVDMPHGEGSSPAGSHQDFCAHQGSNNSITIWIPLQNVELKNGALKVIPKTHLQGFVRDDKNWSKNIVPKNLISEKVASKFGKFVNAPMKLGEAILFSTFSIHKSGINISDKIRFSLNIRFNDIDSEDYADRNFYINEKIQLKTYDVDYEPTVNFDKNT